VTKRFDDKESLRQVIIEGPGPSQACSSRFSASSKPIRRRMLSKRGPSPTVRRAKVPRSDQSALVSPQDEFRRFENSRNVEIRQRQSHRERRLVTFAPVLSPPKLCRAYRCLRKMKWRCHIRTLDKSDSRHFMSEQVGKSPLSPLFKRGEKDNVSAKAKIVENSDIKLIR